MQKKVYFLSGFPRAGNTIISTILNQNKNIATSGHSSLPDCFFKIESIKYTDIYNNFKNNKAIENIQKNLVLNFYKDWKQPYIIDRGEWGTPFNYEIMKKYCPNEFKIIFLLRNPLDIIRSYLKICIDNPNFYINKQFNFLDKTTLHKTELEEKIELITKKGDFFDVSLFTYKNLKNKKNVLFIKYEDFADDPYIEINKIYEFLNIPKYKHSFNIKNQFSVNGMEYDDSIHAAKMHKIYLGKVKNFNHPEIKLPKYIVEKYKGVLYEY
tara:strand:- start:502 stop:1305 length:804 start_codon:yes stop_codon:yes gene_type:complete